MRQIGIVLCTIDTSEHAEKIAHELVSGGLAACVNIIPAIQSIYKWQGKIRQDQELLMIIKTCSDIYPVLERKLQMLHPYDVPEILFIPVTEEWVNYREWILQNVTLP